VLPRQKPIACAQFALQLPKSANRSPSNRLPSRLKWTTAIDWNLSGEMNYKFEDARNISAEETIITRKCTGISLEADPRLSSLVDCIHDCTIILSELDEWMNLAPTVQGVARSDRQRQFACAMQE
jgi:hypothetical protein